MNQFTYEILTEQDSGANAGIALRVSYIHVNSPQLMWRSDNCKRHLRVSGLYNSGAGSWLHDRIPG